jgi:hypothetical protein
MKKWLPLFCVLLMVVGLSNCKSGESSGGSTVPEFVGTWTGPYPSGGTITLTFTNTTMLLYIDLGGGNTYIANNALSGVDEALNHLIVTVVGGSATGTGVPPVVGDFNYVLYSISGNTMKTEVQSVNVPTFPASITANALVLTKGS